MHPSSSYGKGARDSVQCERSVQNWKKIKKNMEKSKIRIILFYWSWN